MENNSKAIDSILKDFQASDVSLVKDAIKRNRKDGNVKTFAAMLDLLANTDEPEVEEAIISFLFDLKENDSVPTLVEALQKDELEYYRSFLVATFWQASIDGSDHLDLFVKLAIEGDYMVCLEALTVIENFDAAYSEHELLDYENDISEAIEREDNKDKKELLISLGDVVRNLPIEGE